MKYIFALISTLAVCASGCVEQPDYPEHLIIITDGNVGLDNGSTPSAKLHVIENLKETHF